MTKALIIVDVQNDFVEGGSLAVEGGVALAEELAENFENLRENYDLIVTTQDWHIEPGAHFGNPPDFVDSWPVHCVADETGSEIVKVLSDASRGKVDYAVKKGQYEAAYSGFEGKTDEGDYLVTVLRDHGVTDVDIVGIAYNYCVYRTALDSKENNFNTRVIVGWTVSIPNGTEEEVDNDLTVKGVKLV